MPTLVKSFLRGFVVTSREKNDETRETKMMTKEKVYASVPDETPDGENEDVSANLFRERAHNPEQRQTGRRNTDKTNKSISARVSNHEHTPIGY